MKRVALFSVTYHPFIGGAEIAIKEFTDRLGSEEFSARGGPLHNGGQAAFGWDLFTAKLDADLPDEERIGNINVYRIGTGGKMDKWLYPWRAARLALKMHTQKPYDLIHAIMATYAGLAALLFKKKQNDVPYILTLQSGDSDLFIWLRTWFWYPLYRQIYTKANHITAISRWLEDRARSYGYKGEMNRIPNGVDVDLFNIELSDFDRRDIRENWNVRDNDFVVITASRLVYKNGIDILIDAMAHLPDDVKLVIAGNGKDEEKLKVKSEKFKDRVIFLGHVMHSKLPELLQSADVFVRPSRSEGMGNSFVEAKVAGLPVLGTEVGGIRDLVRANIVEPIQENTPHGVAKKIQQAVDRPKDLIAQQQSEARDVVREQFNWDYIAEQYEQVYKKLLETKHVPNH